MSKYTNVIRGYQFRYFVVNAEQGCLDYFMSEDMKCQKPRGSIELKKAVISPSEEDSTTFTIHSFENELFKLRAQDAKERQHWVNVLRFVAQSHSNENDSLPSTNLNCSSLNSFNTSASNLTALTSATTNCKNTNTIDFDFKTNSIDNKQMIPNEK